MRDRLLPLLAATLFLQCATAPSTGVTNTAPAWCTPTDRYEIEGGGAGYSITSNARTLFIARRGADCPPLAGAFRDSVRVCEGETCKQASPLDATIREALRELHDVKAITYLDVAGCASISSFVGQNFEALSVCPEVKADSFPTAPGSQGYPSVFNGCLFVPCLPQTCSGGDTSNPRAIAPAPTCDCPADRDAACSQSKAEDCACYDACCSSH